MLFIPISNARRRYALGLVALLCAGFFGISLGSPTRAEAYSQGYYEGYYQAYYQGYYQGYYQAYYQAYYQSYYQGYYQSYYQATYTPAPTCSLSVSPTSVNTGGSATLTWSSTNASSASISPTPGAVATAGSTSVAPAVTTTYTGTFPGPSGTVQCSTTLTVNAPPQVGTAITGYGWSDTIGWIDFNCANTNSCGTRNWGMAIQNDGTLNGLAWSEHIGWISANTADLTSCPSGTCSARISGPALLGWFKVLSANGNGWDGWISLSGSSPAYGPTLSGGTYSGYAWGSDVVGWISFDQVATTFAACNAGYSMCNGNTSEHYDPQCLRTTQDCTQSPYYACAPSNGLCITPPTPSGTLSGSASIRATPALVKNGGTTVITWGVADAASCSVVGTNNDGVSPAWSGTSGTQTSSPISRQIVYTLTCVNLGGSTVEMGQATINLVPQWEER